MKLLNLPLGIVLGLVIGTLISSVYAIGIKTPYESSSNDAASVVAYGYNGTTLVPIHVDSSGEVQLQ